ncbi:MAG: hypothetical protein IJY93_07100 [Clostridia bacterium]|nr:hypothetical protein [Clostridia bacterium]
MKKFLKEQSYNMVKLFLNQIALTVFGTILMLSTSENDSLLLASSIFSILFFLALSYTTCWDIGARDKIRVDSGRLKSMPSKGFVISLGANIPNLILALAMGIGILTNTEMGHSISGFCNIAARLLNGMYLGVISTIENKLSLTAIEDWWIFAVITIPSLFTCTIAYLLGSKNIRILGLLGFKPKTNKKK